MLFFLIILLRVPFFILLLLSVIVVIVAMLRELVCLSLLPDAKGFTSLGDVRNSILEG